jgi:copper resistance protein B
VTLRYAVLLCGAASATQAQAQAQTAPPSSQAPANINLGAVQYYGGAMPVMDDPFLTHVLLEQAEARIGGTGAQFRYDGQGWAGTDTDKLWIKSEGLVGQDGRFGDGQHEVLYDRAVSTFLDLQGGVRVDLDDGPTRTWAAFGVQGLSVYDFDVEATGYASDRGRFAARLKGSYDLPLTNRLFLQPEVEANFYPKADPQRAVGSGLSDMDAGVRLRYEITRKIAPYVGLTYAGYFGQAQHLARDLGDRVQDVRFTIGVRSWF